MLTVGCTTSISGISAARDQIETTCLESDARTYEPGMVTPGTATFGINVDPADASHVRLHQLFVAGTQLNWAIGFGDGTAVPTVDTAGEFILPTSRTWIDFDGYISDYPFDFQLSAVVASTISIQMSGMPLFSPKV